MYINLENRFSDDKDRLYDAKAEALVTLENSVFERRFDMDFIREVAEVHSALCFAYHNLVKEEIDNKIYERKIGVNGTLCTEVLENE